MEEFMKLKIIATLLLSSLFSVATYSMKRDFEQAFKDSKESSDTQCQPDSNYVFSEKTLLDFLPRELLDNIKNYCYKNSPEITETLLQEQLFRGSASKPKQFGSDYDQFLAAATFSNDGKKIAIGFIDGHIKVYSVSGNEQMDLKGHIEHLDLLAWSCDDSKLASVDYDNVVKIWDISTQKCLSTFPGENTKVAWHPNGMALATIVTNDNHTEDVALWNEEGQCQNILKNSDKTYVIAWSPNGQILASGHKSGIINLFDQKGTLIHQLKAHNFQVDDLQWSPNGTMLASDSKDNTYKIWDIKNKTCKASLSGENSDNWFNIMKWNSTSTMLTTGYKDRYIKIWDVVKPACVASLAQKGSRLFSASWNPEGTMLATGAIKDLNDESSIVIIWNSNGAQVAQFLAGIQLGSVQWNADGNTISSGVYGENNLLLWQVANPKVRIALNSAPLGCLQLLKDIHVAKKSKAKIRALAKKYRKHFEKLPSELQEYLNSLQK